MAITSQQLFGASAFCSLRQSVWSGAIALPDSAVELGEGGKKPSRKLASSGELFLIDRKHLRPFNRIKTQLRRLADKYAPPSSLIADLDLVPKSRLDEFQEELATIREASEQAFAEFESNYQTYCDEWLLDPEVEDYADLVRISQPSLDSLRDKFKLQTRIVTIDPSICGQEQEMLADALGLKDELLGDLHAAAEDFLSRKLKVGHKERATQRDADFLRIVRDRINGLSFLNAELNPIVELLDDMLGWNSKSLVGGEFYRLMAGATVLASPSKLAEAVSEHMQQGGFGSGLEKYLNSTSQRLQNGEAWEGLLDEEDVPSISVTPTQAAPVVKPVPSDTVDTPAQDDWLDDTSTPTPAVVPQPETSTPRKKICLV